jgi:hypothetical protein
VDIHLAQDGIRSDFESMPPRFLDLGLKLTCRASARSASSEPSQGESERDNGQ